LNRGEIETILVTGAIGQIGSELTPRLMELYGKNNVVASDIREPDDELNGPFELLDVTNKSKLEEIVDGYGIDAIVHLAALLSATGEQKPQLAWHVNVTGFYNVLEVAREKKLTRIFHPSSIACFGPETPRDKTPQDTIQRPRTIYGITKVTGELLGNYYFEKFSVDVRGARFPGIISNVAPPGGGTTDYAVEIFYEAIKHKEYTCFLEKDTVLPMMYMPDCIKGVIQLMNADVSKLKHHCDFNMAAISFSPSEVAAEIRRHIPEFKITYKPDYRQAIADSWPKSIDDTAARKEWGWKHDYDLPAMVEDMLRVLGARYNQEKF